MKTTYFLGAGASYNAIPTVGELDKAFKNICDQLYGLRSSFLDSVSSSQFGTFEKFMKICSKESTRFGTIDTFAKHLWLIDSNDLKDLKLSLSLFFTLWQELDKGHFSKEIRRDWFEDIDHRYLGLFANYLEKRNGNISLNYDVKFITWNYDTQIERALALLIGSNSTERALDKFNVYPYKYDSSNSNPNIVHLNGIAGLYAEHSKNETHAIFDKTSPNNNLLDILQKVLYTVNSSYTNNRYFTFAWEDDPFSIDAISHATSILKETEILVIIGYSFPTFNDEVDKRLMKTLKESNKFRRVYYQDPNANKELLLARFGIPENKITIVKDINQFVLPLDSHSINPPPGLFEVL